MKKLFFFYYSNKFNYILIMLFSVIYSKSNGNKINKTILNDYTLYLFFYYKILTILVHIKYCF